MWFFVLCLFLTLGIVRVSHWLYNWANPKCNGKLPPGSSGLPFIGESWEFFTPYALHDVQPFVKKRMERYGSIFRTKLLGQNIIVSTDNEINHNIIQQENKSFLLCYTDSFIEIMGRKSIAVQHGTIHKYLRNLILHLISPENLKEIIHEMDELTQRHLNTWSNHDTVEVKERSAEMIIEYFAKKLMSYEEHNPHSGERLIENFKAFMAGLISIPLNFPGTAFHTCIKGRKNTIKVIEGIMEKRKTEKNRRNLDFLDHLLEEAEKKDSILDKTMIIDLIFALLFAAHETTSTSMALAIKFLYDHPQALAELRKEHELILEKRETKETTITWAEYKSMTFTHMVINETVRLANIVPGILRKALTDVEINGYVIPKGWFVMVVPSVVHLDGNKYENPFEFNPWRWEGKELHIGSKTFMAFGGGMRLCAGADFAKVQMAIYLHYLVTKYRWLILKGGNFVRYPGVRFPEGLHIQISKKNY